MTTCTCVITVDTVSSGTVAKARVADWFNGKIELTVAHPRLQVLSARGVREARAGNFENCKMWTDDRERLVKLLSGYAAVDGLDYIKRAKRIVSIALTLLFVASISLYWFNYMTAGLAVDFGLVAALYFISAQLEEINGYMADLMAAGLGNREVDLVVKHADL